MTALTLEELSGRTIAEANSLGLKPGQEQFIAPVTYAAEAGVLNPAHAWQRVVLDEGVVVGYIHVNFDPNARREEFRACIWRINVAAERQGRGIGRFAIDAASNEAKARGFEALTVLWEPGPGGPEEFFSRMGFIGSGETAYGDIIGVRPLD